MITIKDIAAYVNLSPSTVSIVLNGNGDKRKISKNTQKKILEAARKLEYRPNTQAKILRGGFSSLMTITLFWTYDTRLNMLSRFISGIERALLTTGYPYDLQIKPYQNNFLKDSLTQQILLSSSGIIICNASQIDLNFLDNFQSDIPIILYNRSSTRYTTVNMNDSVIGSIPAKIFLQHQKKHPALLKANATFDGMDRRTEAFIQHLTSNSITSTISITVEDSMRGGYDGATTLCSLPHIPDCLFCTSDNIAIGALKAFHDNKIRIPDDIEIISVGNGNIDQQEYSVPSLSVIHLPMEDMAAACLNKLYEAISLFNNNIESIEFPVHYIPRESCPDE